MATSSDRDPSNARRTPFLPSPVDGVEGDTPILTYSSELEQLGLSCSFMCPECRKSVEKLFLPTTAVDWISAKGWCRPCIEAKKKSLGAVAAKAVGNVKDVSPYSMIQLEHIALVNAVAALRAARAACTRLFEKHNLPAEQELRICVDGHCAEVNYSVSSRNGRFGAALSFFERPLTAGEVKKLKSSK